MPDNSGEIAVPKHIAERKTGTEQVRYGVSGKPARSARLLSEEPSGELTWESEWERPDHEPPPDDISESLRGASTMRDYIAYTRSPETGTPRAAMLQQIVDRMTAPRGVRARVVILNAGLEPDAFVTPDRTIYVSQSLINALDTMDEIGFVLAHEVNHILLRTWERERQAAPGRELGVQWVHELAADYTIDLMQDADLNTLIGVSAIRKLSAVSRDSIHQTGLAREAIGVGTHYGIDSRTSNNPPTPIPKELRSDMVEPTASEAFVAAFSDRDDEAQRELALRMHRWDLYRFYVSNLDILGPVLPVVRDQLHRALLSGGYTETETALYMIGCSPSSEIAHYIPDAASLRTVTGDLEWQARIRQWPAMAEWVSGNEVLDHTISIMTNVLDRGTDLAVELDSAEGSALMIDMASRISSLKSVFQSERYDSPNLLLEDLDEIVGTNLLQFIGHAYLQHSAGYPKDEVRIFFDRLTEHGIALPANESYLNDHVNPEFTIIPNRYTQQIALLRRDIEQRWGVREQTIDELIDSEFVLLGPQKKRERQDIQSTLRTIKEKFDRSHIPESDRLQYINRISEHVDRLSFRGRISWRQFLDRGWDPEELPDQTFGAREADENERFYRYLLKIKAGVQLFPEDSDAFYGFIERASVPVRSMFTGLSDRQKINLGAIFISAGDSGKGIVSAWDYNGRWPVEEHLGETVKITRLDRLFAVPEVKAALESVTRPLEHWDATGGSIAQLLQVLKTEMDHSLLPQFFSSKSQREINRDLYGDSVWSLVWGARAREAFDAVIARGITVQEYPDLYTFVDRHFPKDRTQRELLNSISDRIIASESLSIEAKMDHVFSNIGRLGPEGIFAVAGQIRDLPTFVRFRSRVGNTMDTLLGGSEPLTIAAMGEFITSHFIHDYDRLLESMAVSKSGEMTEQLASYWCQNVFSRREGIAYDAKTNTFSVSQRDQLLSVSDIISFLHDLPYSKRLAIAIKALTDPHGLFAGAGGRKKLNEAVLSAYGLQEGFVAESLSAAILHGETKYLTFPIANMMAPLLFRALDTEAINVPAIRQQEIVTLYGKQRLRYLVRSDERLKTLFNSTTRDLAVFGGRYQRQKETNLSEIALESDGKYQAAVRFIRGLAGSRQEAEYTPPSSDTVTGIMRGVQACGAPGIRGLQLASQLIPFDRATETQIADAIDANPGLNAYFFWENLYRQTLEDPGLAAFIADNNLHVDAYAGGGSLQTTFSGTIDMPWGVKHVVIKLLNPNAAAFVATNHQLATDTFGRVDGTTQLPESKHYAEIAQGMADLSQNWCLTDILDPGFMEDDARFARMIGGYKPEDPDVSVSVPQVFFHSQKVTVEEQARGKTVNKVLHDDRVPQETKRRIVQAVSAVYRHQMQAQIAESDDRHILQSDPSMGNFMVDVVGKHLFIGIIDRTMPFTKTTGELSAFGKLDRGDLAGFVTDFVARACEENKVRNPVRVTGLTMRVMAEAATAARETELGSALAVQHMFNTLHANGITVPLWMRLMVRNVAAFSRLRTMYGID